MSEYLLLVLAGVTILILVVLAWMLRAYQKLKHDYQLLAAQIQRSNEDVAGLCSAAVAVDRRLAANDMRLSSIAGQVNTQQHTVAEADSYQPSSPPAQGYEAVIQNIRRGAGVEELVKDFGLTRDEAVLLKRLHG